MIDREISIPRRVPPGLRMVDTDFGADTLDVAVEHMVDRKGGPVFRFSGTSFALFAPSGQGKSAVAAALVHRLRREMPWCTTLHTPWTTATWLAEHAISALVDDVTLEPIPVQLAKCWLLVIDGLGEEPERFRDRISALTKARLDNGKAMVITSRLRLDGPGSLAQIYPHLRSALDRSFVYSDWEKSHA